MSFCHNWLRMVLINFHLFPLIPPQHVHLFTIPVKNQAMLTRKIVGSYSQAFRVYKKFDSDNFLCPTELEDMRS